MLIWNFKLRNPLLLLILVVPKKNLSIKLGKYQRDNLMLLRMSIASDIKFFLPKTKNTRGFMIYGSRIMHEHVI
jgi:hypothetical protein